MGAGVGRWARAEEMGWGGSGGLLLCGKGALGCGLRVVGIRLWGGGSACCCAPQLGYEHREGKWVLPEGEKPCRVSSHGRCCATRLWHCLELSWVLLSLFFSL